MIFDPRRPELDAWLASLDKRERCIMLHAIQIAFPLLAEGLRSAATGLRPVRVHTVAAITAATTTSAINPIRIRRMEAPTHATSPADLPA